MDRGADGRGGGQAVRAAEGVDVRGRGACVDVVLQVRVQQTVRSQESAITAYKVANLLQFYLITMRRTLGDESLLCQTLQE